jgi:hypothetical protein
MQLAGDAQPFLGGPAERFLFPAVRAAWARWRRLRYDSAL